MAGAGVSNNPPVTAAALAAMLAAAGLAMPDDKWSLYKAGDATAIQIHSLAGYSTGTTRTITWPNASLTVAGLEVAQTFTATQTVRAAGGVVTLQAATQDAMRLLGRAGGTSSYVHTQTVVAQSASRTATWPDATGTVPLLELAQSFTANQTFTANVTQTGTGTLITGTGVGSYNHSAATFAGRFNVNGNDTVANLISIGTVTTGLTTGTTQRGMRITAEFGADASTLVTSLALSVRSVAGASTPTTMLAINVESPVLGGAVPVTLGGIRIAQPTGASGANVALILGTGVPTAGAWSIYNTGSQSNNFGTGQSIFPANGSAAAPTIQFSASEAHGFYRVSATAIGVSIAGAIATQIGTAGVTCQFASGGSAFVGGSVTDGAMVYMAGSSTSASGQLRTYGSTHATKANYRELSRGATVDVTIDGSGNVWMAASSVVGGTTFVGSERLRIAGGSAATAGATDVLIGAGIIDMGVSLRYRSAQVVSAPKTGYTNLMTGAANRATAYDTATITLVQLAERVKAMEDDLHFNAGAGHGLLAA